jgi:ABC-2 type transport system permease protein
MSKTITIFRNELIRTISRPSFIISLLIFPVIMGVVIFVTSTQEDTTSSTAISALTGNTGELHEGYVDLSGLIKALPPEVEEGTLSVYNDITSANQALTDRDIDAYYVVPKDYLLSGKINYVRADYNPLSGLENSLMFRDVLDFNLLGQDIQKADRYWTPIRAEEVALEESVTRDATNPMSYMLPYFVGLILYVVIISSASLLLNNISTEKENRVIEMLVASASPQAIMNGKILALGVVGLLQTGFWASAGLIVLNLSNQNTFLSGSLYLPPLLILWIILYFLLGYAIYASLMAGVGALAPGMKEASQATMLVVMPLLIPLILSPSFSMTPDNAFSVALSIIPFTAPVSMITRLTAGSVPTWQLTLSLGLMLVTAILVAKAVAGLFRAQTMLTGQNFNLLLFLKALIGRA